MVGRAGGGAGAGHLTPVGCRAGHTYPAHTVELHWPTKLALNPLDNSLHIVDDSQVGV